MTKVYIRSMEGSRNIGSISGWMCSICRRVCSTCRRVCSTCRRVCSTCRRMCFICRRMCCSICRIICQSFYPSMNTFQHDAKIINIYYINISSRFSSNYEEFASDKKREMHYYTCSTKTSSRLSSSFKAFSDSRWLYENFITNARLEKVTILKM